MQLLYLYTIPAQIALTAASYLVARRAGIWFTKMHQIFVTLSNVVKVLLLSNKSDFQLLPKVAFLIYNFYCFVKIQFVGTVKLSPGCKCLVLVISHLACNGSEPKFNISKLYPLVNIPVPLFALVSSK